MKDKVDGIRSWVITLVSVSIICTIVEAFAPQGKFNKYVQLVCGLAVTVAIAMPFINIINSGFKLETMVWKDYVTLSDRELQKRIEELQEEDKRHLLEVYRQSIIADIKGRFLGEGDFLVKSVDAVFYEDQSKENFGMIRAMYLVLTPGRENRQKTIDNSTIEAIKDELSHTFSMDRDKIIIDLSSFNGGE